MHTATKTIIKRSGESAEFDPDRIQEAIRAAFLEVLGNEPLPDSAQIQIELVVGHILERIHCRESTALPLHVEAIQDIVENALMSLGHHRVAKAYILYRHRHKQQREAAKLQTASYEARDAQGNTVFITEETLLRRIRSACGELNLPHGELASLAFEQLYHGMALNEVNLALILAARSRSETDPIYSLAAARLLLHQQYRELLGEDDPQTGLERYFPRYIHKGVELGKLDPRLLDFDLPRLSAAMVASRDLKLEYLGVQTLHDRYFICADKQRLETPQILWMRVAMGLSLLEGKQRNERAIAFYEVLSTLRYVSATPTLFNAGTTHPQLSSCYLSTIEDDLEHIFHSISNNAKLSKWAGGLGNDWTNVRATGALIHGTGGPSQGIVPFLKVANDTVLAVNQGGKRKGVACAYLEPWHLDFEEFIELRKNTGDDRRRTHDMNTASWIPDLFMKRVLEKGSWTLFSPDEVPDLHDLYGEAFEARYCEYERMIKEGKIKRYKQMDAQSLWRSMLSRLFETGHPWITFKDPSNLRSPQDHVGVVHSSNLCTEILLNTCKEEVAVCNLGSVNLAEHIDNGTVNYDKLADTVRIAVRMLDNVIDINFYPIPEARTANLRHRPIGLGQMGFQDLLYQLQIPYASEQAVQLADEIAEALSYHALLTSSNLALERGTYSSYKGSKWNRGLLPLDTARALHKIRGKQSMIDLSSKLDWQPVRDAIAANGMRNSCVMAIAPTATIANIAGVTPSIEPSYKHLYVKSNLSGEFTVLNPHLVRILKQQELWSESLIDDLKYFDGSLSDIVQIPEEVRQLFKTAFEIEPRWLIECASRRQKWIDQGQSLNLYFHAPKGKTLSDTYFLAWRMGLKTTYYARTLAATQIEKSTVDINQRGLQPKWMKHQSASAGVQVNRTNACTLDDESCECCQ